MKMGSDRNDDGSYSRLAIEDLIDKRPVTVTVGDLSKSLQIFCYTDYVIFFIMLLLCALIGVYFGIIDKRHNKSPIDYLMGGRSMAVFPISLSLIASYISGITLLGFPTEIYIYGTQFSYSGVSLILMAVLMCYCYLPTLHNLKLTSSYEYLSMRFDNRVRLFGSILFCLSIMNWLPLVIYVPALAFNQVTGINVHIVTPFVSLVCVFYTTLGGLKAVVWTDVLQTFSMFGAIILVCIKGTLDVGGLNEVIQRNFDTGRIEMPDMRLDPTVRHTIWGLMIGGTMSYLQSNAISQSMIQRYMALPNLNKAKMAVWGFTIGTLLLVALCTYSGMVVFATYHKCDPLSTQLAKAKDQLLPLLVMETLGEYPGLPGLFVAGVFSAALSSMSTGLNSMSAVILEDFYKNYLDKEPTERATNIIMRSVVIVTGIICVILVYVVEKLGQVLQLSMSLSAITNGPALGVFTMGLFLPWINSTGALWGGLTGLLSMVWLVLGTQNALARGLLKFQPKPVSIEGCHYLFNHSTPINGPHIPSSLIIDNIVIDDDKHFNSTRNIVPTSLPPKSTLVFNYNYPGSEDEVFYLFRLSYMWYTCIGVLISILSALIITYLTSMTSDKSNNLKIDAANSGGKYSNNKSNNDDDTMDTVYGVDINLLSPVVRRYYVRRKVNTMIISRNDLNTNLEEISAIKTVSSDDQKIKSDESNFTPNDSSGNHESSS